MDSDVSDCADDFEVLSEDQLLEDDIAEADPDKKRLVDSVHSSLLNSVLSLRGSSAALSLVDCCSALSEADAKATSAEQEAASQWEASSSQTLSSSGGDTDATDIANEVEKPSDRYLDVSEALKNPVVLQLRHSERLLSACRSNLEQLQVANEALRTENERHLTDMQTRANEVASLKQQVEVLLNENRQLKETCSAYEQRDQLNKFTFDKLKSDLTSLQSLNVALQLQVEADTDHVTALTDRHQLQIEILTHQSHTRNPHLYYLPPADPPRLMHQYVCKGCCSSFATEEQLLIHLHRCGRFLALE